MINCGIIGYGIMGQIRHKTCDLINGFNVVKIYDPNKDIVSNSLWASSEKEIIENEDIDVIFICTPNYLNKDLTIEEAAEIVRANKQENEQQSIFERIRQQNQRTQ